MNANTIKAKVRKENADLQIVSVKKANWGFFSVKVKKETTRTTKIGMVHGAWNGGDVQLEKVEWLGSV